MALSTIIARSQTRPCRPHQGALLDCFGRAVRAGGVFQERHQPLSPGLQDRFYDSPRLFGLVGSDEEGGIALQQVEEEAFVSGEKVLGCEVCAQLYLLQVEGVVGTVDVHVKGYPVRSQLDAEHIGAGIERSLEREVGHRLEVDGNLAQVAAQSLPRAQHERHPRPAQVVYHERNLGESLGLPLGVHAFFVGVSRDNPLSDLAGTVAGTHGLALHLLGGETSDGPQYVYLAVTQIAPVECDGCLHGSQAEKLEEVVLDQVLESAGGVEVAGSALQS